MSLFAPAPDFDAGDGFLHALLGLVAAGAAVRALATSPSTPTPPPAQRPRPAADAGDPVLDAILGIIHLTSLASGVASSWATAPGDVASAPDLACAATPIEGLLR